MSKPKVQPAPYKPKNPNEKILMSFRVPNSAVGQKFIAQARAWRTERYEFVDDRFAIDESGAARVLEITMGIRKRQIAVFIQRKIRDRRRLGRTARRDFQRAQLVRIDGQVRRYL